MPIPAGAPLGTYRVILTATTGELGRSNTATITVVDRIAPAIRVSTPSEGAAFTVGTRVRADYVCADQPNGTGLRTCSGPVATGAALDTASPGEKTFRVTTTDAAGNTATATRRYRVIPPPPPERLDFTLAFDFARATTSTRFTRLLVKDAPRGATLEVTCRGRSCPTRSGRRLRFTQRVGTRAISLRPWIRRSLRAGTVLTVTVTRPGAVGRVKTLIGPHQPPAADENDVSAPELEDRPRVLLRVSRIPPTVGLTASKAPRSTVAQKE